MKYETFFSPDEFETLYHLVVVGILGIWKDDEFTKGKLMKIKMKMDNITWNVEVEDGKIYTDD